MNVYLIPGLAADYRIFHHLRLPQGYVLKHLKWISVKKEDNLISYALRLAEQIDRSKPFCLVGLSMGGMIATEIAKHFSVEQLILISSITSPKELPSWYRWGYAYGGKYLLQKNIIHTAMFIRRWLTRESIQDKELIRNLVSEMDSIFVHQCIQLILGWKTNDIPVKAFKIHGSADWVLPLRLTTADHVIPGGSHLMIFDRAAEINQVLRKIL